MLTRVTASAPPSTAARAMSGSPTSPMLGLSLAHRGRRQASVAASTSAVSTVEWPNISLPASVLGHEMLTSTATTAAGASASNSAARR